MSTHFTFQQTESNIGSQQFTLREKQTTRQVRHLIEHLTGKKLTAQSVLRQGRTGKFEIESTHGTIIVTVSRSEKTGRSWLWDVHFTPYNLVRLTA